MRIIVNHRFYNSYGDACSALGNTDTIPEGLPVPTSYSTTFEMLRDGDGNAVLIVYSDSGVVLNYFHAYYDEVQKIWRWQV